MGEINSQETGRYLYCVTYAGALDGLELKGIDDGPVGLVVDNDPSTGSGQAPSTGSPLPPVGDFAGQALAVVVSPSAVKRYRLSRQYTMTHEMVIEQVMAHATALPVKFGTVAENEQAIREKVLRDRGDDLRRLLAEMDGKVELGLKALWNQERIYADIVQRDPAIRRLRDQLASRPAAEGHYDRIRLGEMVEAAINDRRQADADVIMEQLTPLAVDTRRNNVYGEMMVLNAAFLIEKAREAEFDAAVQALDREWAGLVTLKYVGPLPVFNFVDLVISWS
jgi:hypothetical protein